MVNKQDIQTIVQQISDVLLMNGGFLSDPGLYTGEMGLVLFFAHYSRYTQNDLYFEYCYGLMEKIQNRIHRETPINYKQGLAGIGSAIEYFVQNDFFEADTDEILEDFDKRIFFTYNLPNLSIDQVIDIGCYAAWRMSGNSAQKDMIQQTILSKIEKIMNDHFIVPVWKKLRCKKIPDSMTNKTYNHCIELITKNNFWGNEMGLQNGLAGWGMSLLTELDGDDSWFSLLTNNLKIESLPL